MGLEYLWYGFLFAVGGIATLLFVGFLCYQLGIRAKDFPRTKEALEKAKERKPVVEFAHLTDSDLRQKVLRAAMELDLWVRAATARGMRVDAELIQHDAGTLSNPLPRPVFKLKVNRKEAAK